MELAKMNLLRTLSKNKRNQLTQEEILELSKILDSMPTPIIEGLALELSLEQGFITFGLCFKKLAFVIRESLESFHKTTKIKDFTGTYYDEKTILTSFYLKNIISKVPVCFQNKLREEIKICRN